MTEQQMKDAWLEQNFERRANGIRTLSYKEWKEYQKVKEDYIKMMMGAN